MRLLNASDAIHVRKRDCTAVGDELTQLDVVGAATVASAKAPRGLLAQLWFTRMDARSYRRLARVHCCGGALQAGP
ncbi:hypothetical protein [Dactylosporangium darangshiense]|uniref:hypothetical protein n=1 Tax=Dactylosporangium darangshiense TaxID=579108 RepID=UPI003626C0AA